MDISRTKVLQSYQILDTEPEGVFDDLTQLAASFCKTRYAAISIIDDDRQWFKSKVGFDLYETPNDESICYQLVSKYHDGLYAEDLKLHDYLSHHPAVSQKNIRFYAGYPIKSDSNFILGSFCVFDNEPQALDENQLSQLEILSRQAMQLINLKKANLSLKSKNESLNSKLEFFEIFSRAQGVAILQIDLCDKKVYWSSKLNELLNLPEDFYLTFDSFELRKLFPDFIYLKKLLRNIYKNIWTGSKDNTFNRFRIQSNKKELLNLLYYNNRSIFVIVFDTSIFYMLRNKYKYYAHLMRQIERVSNVGGFEFFPKTNRVNFTSNSYKIFGLEKSEQLDFQKIYDFFDDKSKSEINEDLLKSKSQRKFYCNIRKLILRNGDVRWLKVSAVPIFSEKKIVKYIGSVLDVTDDYNIKRELTNKLELIEKSSTLFNSVVEGNQIYVVIFNIMGEIEFCNKFLESTYINEFGYSKENLNNHLKEKFSNYIEKLNDSKLENNFLSFKTVELDLNKINKSISWNVSFNSVLKNNTCIYTFIGIDTTELEQNKFQNDKLVDLASKQRKSLIDFNNIVSHNLRSQVANLHGLLNLLDLVEDNDEHDLYIDLIKKTTQNLDSVLHQLNKFTTFSNSDPVSVELVNVFHVLENVCSSLLFKFSKSEYSIIYSLSPDLILLSSEEYLSRIFTYIIDNCIRYRSDKRVLRIEISATQINSETLLIEIKDNGVGIELGNDPDKLFRLYSNYHSISGDKGFGLFFTKKLVNLLGGSITIQSKIDVGTTVSIKIPNNET